MTVSVASKPPEQPETKPLRLAWDHVVFFTVFHSIALGALVFNFSWAGLGVALLLHWCFGSLGICLGYHRLLSHRSFQVPLWLERVFALFGALAIQGGPIFWVASHRQHHAYTEHEEKDPYSARRGFWWSHIMWLIYQRDEVFNPANNARLAPDISRDPFYRWLDRNHLVPQVILGLLLYGLGEWTGFGGWTFVTYGIFLRAVTLWHCTWLINSASHFWGYRRFDDSDDNARNLWWAAILAYGEGWHNNHHADPKCAKAGLTWWEIDMTFWAIWVLEKVGLARKVHRPAAH